MTQPVIIPPHINFQVPFISQFKVHTTPAQRTPLYMRIQHETIRRSKSLYVDLQGWYMYVIITMIK
jgi:hypothetical protein